jgi:glutathionylspermidine synthase
MTTKEKEINTLKALVAMGGYFAEYFGRDLDTMVGNIKNDFPIEVGTQFNAVAERAKERANGLDKKHAEEIFGLCSTMLCVHAETGNARLYECAVEKIGRKNVIACKRSLGLDVTGEEVDFLLKNVSL